MAIRSGTVHKWLDKRKVSRLGNSISIFLMMFVIIFFIMLVKAYLDGDFRSIDDLQSYIKRYGIFGPVVLVMIQAIQVVFPILPSFLGCAVGSLLYGPLIGFLCNYIGISIGSVAAFYLARKYGEPLVRAIFPVEKYSRWSRRISESSSYTGFLFMAMLLPLFPDDYLCYFTGLTKMSIKKFAGIIFVGKPWCILAYSIGFAMIR